jgi:hypothetical protein
MVFRAKGAAVDAKRSVPYFVKDSGSFLKKRTKKLLLYRSPVFGAALAQIIKSPFAEPANWRVCLEIRSGESVGVCLENWSGAAYRQ